MDYRIIWSIQASKQMERLDRSVAKRIHEKVGQLYQNPERYVEKLVRYPYYRLRVGDYMVILDIQNEMIRIFILKVGHRSNVYER
ncbi:MAG: type II toxin-antitoxin system RelE/ParE family toxin [Thermoplasmataceae archaeon]|jgi:mRNA interferase RelE/StbE|nr:type II toxin-antitoxin system RelE/ParE family toxin [Candidatus Thermoplasmatota archaeon]MCL5787003.1 type II toxin-antitoxin system RelE/ParE family toxin [Candidatus Thermoplasmatota archaeon]